MGLNNFICIVGNDWDAVGGCGLRHDLCIVLRTTSYYHQCYRTTTCLRINPLPNLQVRPSLIYHDSFLYM